MFEFWKSGLPIKRWANYRKAAPTLALGLILAGCATRAPLPPMDLSAPGWNLTETAAVWRPRTEAPELIGELTVARNPDGGRWVQFSKHGLPVVTAQLTTNVWQISSTLRSGIHSGNFPPPSRVLWFQIDRLPPFQPPQAPWKLQTNLTSWRLFNPTTGESLEGAQH